MRDPLADMFTAQPVGGVKPKKELDNAPPGKPIMWEVGIEFDKGVPAMGKEGRRTAKGIWLMPFEDVDSAVDSRYCIVGTFGPHMTAFAARQEAAMKLGVEPTMLMVRPGKVSE
jgi:hypothetical protein